MLLIERTCNHMSCSFSICCYFHITMIMKIFTCLKKDLFISFASPSSNLLFASCLNLYWDQCRVSTLLFDQNGEFSELSSVVIHVLNKTIGFCSDKHSFSSPKSDKEFLGSKGHINVHSFRGNREVIIHYI